jgi:hypothetical protein
MIRKNLILLVWSVFLLILLVGCKLIHPFRNT